MDSSVCQSLKGQLERIKELRAQLAQLEKEGPTEETVIEAMRIDSEMNKIRIITMNLCNIILASARSKLEASQGSPTQQL